jgi:tRNA A-37 threonylcarbamoyl transferase component Bud32
MYSRSKGGYDIGSLERYESARSSLSSYATAPSAPRGCWPSTITRPAASADHLIANEVLVGFPRPTLPPLPPSGHAGWSSKLLDYRNRHRIYQAELEDYLDLINLIVSLTLAAHDLEYFRSADAVISLQDHLLPLLNVRYDPDAIVQELVTDIENWMMSVYQEQTAVDLKRSQLAVTMDQVTSVLQNFCSAWDSGEHTTINEAVISSEWLRHLHSRGIILSPRDELDGLGRGQHVEFAPEEENLIPLQLEKTVGHSNTAVIESVKCRRIRLARKKIRCARSLTKEEAVTEVEHLQRLQHFHIVRIVGTHTLKKDLAILLYPVADCNLAEYMDDMWLYQGDRAAAELVLGLGTFVGCLSTAMEHIHGHNVKHLDIKPQNILVRLNGCDIPKIYIADFGIARSYQKAADAETDTPVSFTRAYAAPEVLRQHMSNAPRGFKADIFSLGCVFIEIVATMMSSRERNEREKLYALRTLEHDTSFHANMPKVLPWLEKLVAESRMCVIIRKIYGSLLIAYPTMVQETAAQRPTAAALAEKLCGLGCKSCRNGPEPFAAAEN